MLSLSFILKKIESYSELQHAWFFGAEFYVKPLKTKVQFVRIGITITVCPSIHLAIPHPCLVHDFYE